MHIPYFRSYYYFKVLKVGRRSQNFFPTFKIASNTQLANKLLIESFLKEGSNLLCCTKPITSASNYWQWPSIIGEIDENDGCIEWYLDLLGNFLDKSWSKPMLSGYLILLLTSGFNFWR